MKSTSRVLALAGLVSLVVAGISLPVSAQAPLEIRIGWVVAPAQLTPMLFEKKEILKHQPCEDVTGTGILVAWFAHGLRIIDIVNPHAPREVASVPPVPEGASRVSSNDVTVDGRGLLYLLDRSRGMHIVERT